MWPCGRRLSQRAKFAAGQKRALGFVSAQTLAGNSAVAVSWDDGRSGHFPALWLRDNCPGFHLASARQAKGVEGYHSELSHGTFVDATISDRGALNVKWNDGHTSTFTADYLRRYHQEAIQKVKRSLPQVLSAHNPIPVVEYAEFTSGDVGVFKALKAINDLGGVKITGCPITTECCDELTKKLCEVPMYLAHYGTGGEFVTGAEKTAVQRACPNCVCNVPKPIELHQDSVYQQEVPGLFFNFCQRLDDGVVGGANMAMDVFHIAETLRRTNPEAFHVLSTTSIVMEKNQGAPAPVYQSVERPIIGVDAEGNITDVLYSSMVVKTHHLSGDQLQRFIDARQAWKDVMAQLAEEGFEVITKMRPGDCTVLNNKRVAHGRLPFESVDGIRQFRRWFGMESLWLSRYRVLQRSQEGINATHVYRGGSALTVHV